MVSIYCVVTGDVAHMYAVDMYHVLGVLGDVDVGLVPWSHPQIRGVLYGCMLSIYAPLACLWGCLLLRMQANKEEVADEQVGGQRVSETKLNVDRSQGASGRKTNQPCCPN